MQIRKSFRRIAAAPLYWLMTIAVLSAGASATAHGDECLSHYVFSWSLAGKCNPQPRGGTSTGIPVTLDGEASPQWRALQEKGLSKFERDRRAILAMAGPYRASFEFIETVGFSPRFTPAAPYQSWGTEYIHVVEDREDFISLQHVMVMFTREGEEISGPHVMKHWRQDWQYEKREILHYAGNDTWEKQPLPPEQAGGTWAQAVYQVDDSPRYESYGTWQHNSSFSTWQSALTWRPLPRRESSVRDDYSVLEGYNRHTILPAGWVQEEENLKLQLAPGGKSKTYLARELGNNRYQRIAGFDFSAGDAYWQETGAFWQIVRDAWAGIIDSNQAVTLKKHHDDTPMFMAIFQLADDFRSGSLPAADAESAVSATLQHYLLE